MASYGVSMAWANRFDRNFFSASGHCQRGENLVFRYNNGYKQRLGPLVPKQTQFSDLFSWARAHKLAENEINNGKGNSASASRFASLSEGSMQQILTERHSGKSKQITNWSVSTFKGKLKFFRFKIVKYQPRAFNRKIEIKLIPILLHISLTANNHFWYCCPLFTSDFQDCMYNSTGYVIKQLVHALACTIELWSTREVWRALKKLELPSAIASGNSYASFVLSKLSACSITR